MKLLALETSAEMASVALAVDNHMLTREGGTPGTHASFILGWVRELLDEAGLKLDQLDAVAFSAGPGSFTGLRLAVSVAQGLALGAGLPLVGVPTLDALALGCGDGLHLCCIDARMSEVYSVACEVRGSHVESRTVIRVGPPDSLPPPPDGAAGWHGCGSGFRLPSVAQLAWTAQLASIDADAVAHARHVALLARPRLAAGQFIDAALASPLYVRDKVAQTTAERLAAGGRA